MFGQAGQKRRLFGVRGIAGNVESCSALLLAARLKFCFLCAQDGQSKKREYPAQLLQESSIHQ
jgi:hypothetical protein